MGELYLIKREIKENEILASIPKRKTREDILRRRELVSELRQKGYSYSQIAAKLGITRKAVGRILKRKKSRNIRKRI